VAHVSIEHAVTGNCALVFVLDVNLRVDKVVLAEKELQFFQPREPKDRPQSYGDCVAVVLPEKGQRGLRQTLEFTYHGKRIVRKVGQGQFFCQSFGWYPGRPNSFATRAEFEINSR
jgi:hypothetical protein